MSVMKKTIYSLLLVVVAMLVCAQPAQAKKDMCVQLYSLRTEIGNPELYAKNHVEVFKALAKMGYTSVEAANYDAGGHKFYGVSPQQFKSDVEAAGLKVLSSHATRGLSDEELASGNLTEALKWWDGCIADHKAAGMKYIVTPGFGTPRNLKDGKVICEYHNAIGKKCREAGIKYGYHTHSHEYQKVDGQVWIDYMMKNIAPENMFWQMDVYWCMMAQQSPVAWFKKYPGRCRMLHIKDQYEIGQSGMVGFDAIFNNAAVAGLENYVVELEEFGAGKGWYQAMNECSDYLLKAKFVKSSYDKKK